MTTKLLLARRLAAALLFCLGITSVYAQTSEDPDPPDRAGRLSLVEGDVSLQPAGAQDWANAIVNRPLTTGDKLWSDEGGRAEVQVGQATVHLGSHTGFSFLNVDDDTVQMRMTAGVVNVRVWSLDSNDHMEIDTPNLALSLLRPGSYRVEVNDAGDTTVVKVSEGTAEATGGSQDVVVHPQQAVTFRGTDQLTADVGTLGAPDAFDSWSLERDRREQTAQSSPSAQYVSPDVTGYEDLDANGTWSSEPEYGYVWTPRVVAVDWAPYRYGRWVWVAPWGWTWIDDAPWGFAPFHYGRWARVRDRWCWIPGPRHVRAVYAPALVGWVGTPDFSVSITVGGGPGVAWFPLGPREVYVPARRFSPRYVERVNVSNTVIVDRTYITNVYENRVTNITYRNRSVPGAVTAVTRTTFTSAQPVGRHVVHVDQREITRVRATGAAPRIEPPRQAILGVSDAARRNVRVPPQAVRERQVVTRRAPPPSAARFVRNAAPPASGSEMADRVRRREADRNEAIRRDEEAARNRAASGAQAAARDQAAARNEARDQARDRANERASEAAREQRDRRSNPPQVRTDRPARIDRPAPQNSGTGSNATPNRGPGNATVQPERPLRNDRPPRVVERERQNQTDLSAQGVQRAEQAARNQQMQRDLNAQRERRQREQQAQSELNARQREQREHDQQVQRQQQIQRERQAQQAQRESNARQAQQARDQQTQREQQLQREQQARREQAQRQQEVQREQQQELQRQRAASAARPNPRPEAPRTAPNDRPQRPAQSRPEPSPRQPSDRNDRGRDGRDRR